MGDERETAFEPESIIESHRVETDLNMPAACKVRLAGNEDVSKPTSGKLTSRKLTVLGKSILAKEIRILRLHSAESWLRRPC